MTALGTYRAKRDFTLTSEPAGKARANGGHSFVVQKHDATRLHYDFRLELDGVLKSWAVPKGPSLSPKDKRLAVEVEDHPVDYGDFEGTIPDGEYGGGPVIVWDRGEWKPIGDAHAGLAKGRLEFELEGEKLHGKFILVRTANRGEKKPHWLLIKRSDEHVREGDDAEIVARLPASVLTGRTIDDVTNDVPAKKTTSTKMPRLEDVQPQLALLVDKVPVGPEWIYEMKYDGYRILASIDHGKVRLSSRNGKDWSDRFPEISAALARVRAKSAIFDGEVAYVKEDGRSDFQELQNVLGGRGDRGRLAYFIFDLLHDEGVDKTSEPLSSRKSRLRALLAGTKPPLVLADHVTTKGEAFFEAACKADLEGIIAKRFDRPYRAGRGPDWVKVKCQKRQEMVIVGFTRPKGSRGGLGALLLAVRDGKGYRYAGKVGTGFTQASLTDLAKRLAKIVVDEPTATGAPKMSDATWVEPKLVCEVRFTEWTRDGALRHPTFQGLREDKKSTEVIREAATPTTVPGLTHAERVIDEKSGATKGDLAKYHAAVGSLLLPFAAKRPLMLVRCPEVGAKCFVQKHAGRGLGAKIGHADVEGEEVLFITKESELLELAQYSVIELHGWGSRLPKWDAANWVVFDLDPDEALPFSRVVAAASGLRDELKELGLTSFVKTTGGKGLHVVVPLKPAKSWDAVHAFAAEIAVGMAKRSPKEFVATMSKAARRGKIFVDYFRNAKGNTAVLPYSPRARPGMTVALPIAWSDLEGVDPRALTIFTVPEIVAKRRVDPWADLGAVKQSLPRR